MYSTVSLIWRLIRGTPRAACLVLHLLHVRILSVLYCTVLYCVLFATQGYIPLFKEMTLPEDFVGKDKIVWGNVQGIYEFHKECARLCLSRVRVPRLASPRLVLCLCLSPNPPCPLRLSLPPPLCLHLLIAI